MAADKFSVSLIFWDDVVSGLVLNPSVFQAHYPQVALSPGAVADRERQLAALELGYYGAERWNDVTLIYGEFGWMAQADPDELIATLRSMERRVSQLLAPADAGPLLQSLAEVSKGCLAEKTAKSDWDRVEVHAKRVQARLRAATSLLPASEARMLELASQLGRIYHHTDDLPPKETRTQIKVKVKSVLPGSQFKGDRQKVRIGR